MARMMVQTRREFLRGLLLLASATVFSCKNSSKEEGKVYPSTVDDIKPKLDRMLEILQQKRFDLTDAFKPGLSRDEVVNKTRGLPFTLPPELIELYTWRNGTINTWLNSADPLFIFRDHSFLDLNQAIEAIGSIKKYYGISNVFPFASFQGSYLVLPTEPFSFDKRLERPVVNIYQGVCVFFFSFSTMLDTVIEWIGQGVHAPHGGYVDEKLELEIWKKYNPGFQEIYK